MPRVLTRVEIPLRHVAWKRDLRKRVVDRLAVAHVLGAVR